MKKILATFLLLMLTAITYAHDPRPLPQEVHTIMEKSLYQHAKWGIFVKNLHTKETLYALNTDTFIIPASTSKLFTVAALLNTYGPNHSITTPVYALGNMKSNHVFQGNLVLVAQGDLIFGGRALPDNTVAFTNFDHIDANHLDGAQLTPQDPLAGLQNLAKQIKNRGFKKIHGEIIIDTHLFDTFTQRENVISPIMINDNLYDFTINPAKDSGEASVQMRPRLPGFKIINKITTVEQGQPTAIQIKVDQGKIFELTGTIARDKKDLVKTYPIENPQEFASEAFKMALENEGITVKTKHWPHLMQADVQTQKPVATIISPPMIETARLILKVSHNMGANLVPPLIAVTHQKQSYMEGMRYIGDFLKNTVKIDPASVSFFDAAGEDSNYITPAAGIQLLEYFHSLPENQFKQIIYTLPILGKDGSLSQVGLGTPAQNHVFAKTGTGITYNQLYDSFLLTSKALAGFYQNSQGEWIAFYLVVNQGNLPDLYDVLEVNNDLGLITNALFMHSG